MDDEQTVQIESEIQRLTNRNYLNPNNNNIPIIFDSFRIDRVFNNFNILKYITLLIFIIFIFLSAGLNQMHRIDYKDFKYSDNYLIEDYLQNFYKNIKLAFLTDKFSITNDELIDNSDIDDENYGIINNKNSEYNEKSFKSLDNQAYRSEIKETFISNEKTNNRFLSQEENAYLNKYTIPDLNKEENNEKNNNVISKYVSSTSSKRNMILSESSHDLIKTSLGHSIINSIKDNEIKTKRFLNYTETLNRTTNYHASNSNENNEILNMNKSLIIKNSSSVDGEFNINDDKRDLYRPGEVFYFLNNITQYEYSGKWKGSNPNNMFDQGEGAMNMEIRKNSSQKVFNLIPNIEYFRILEFTFSAKDGDYRDNWMIFNFTMKFPKNFYKNFLPKKDNSEKLKSKNNDKNSNGINIDITDQDDKENKRIMLIEENVVIKYYIGELFETKNITQCNRSHVELEFLKDQIFKVENFDNINSVEYSKIKGKISDTECNFEFEFSLQTQTEEVSFSLLYF